MFTIDHARKRIVAVLGEIDRLKESDFPYTYSRDALDLLKEKFEKQKSILEKISPNSTASVVQNACSASLEILFLYVPILGFILRSTNIRNSFETYAPLLRLARILLGNDTKLIISSEWDFSPFVYRSITDLPDFVLIGLPAPESPNPLLVSLAGHELGHSVWEAKNFTKLFERKIEKSVLTELTEKKWEEYSSLYPYYKKEDVKRGGDFVIQDTWMNAYTWALLQTEEIFCDFFGLRLFAESYLYAFTYLISPGSPGGRSFHYPNISRRVSHLLEAAKKLDVKDIPNFDSFFIDSDEPSEPVTKMLLSIADNVSASFVNDLIELVRNLSNKKSIPKRDPNRVSNIRKEFQKRVAPTSRQESLVDILNAGWICEQDDHLWENIPQIRKEERSRILRDLTLKSMEISEILERLRIIQ